MKTTTASANALHIESREYRGLRRVRTLKALASRMERRTVRQSLKTESF